MSDTLVNINWLSSYIYIAVVFNKSFIKKSVKKYFLGLRWKEISYCHEKMKMLPCNKVSLCVSTHLAGLLLFLIQLKQLAIKLNITVLQTHGASLGSHLSWGLMKHCQITEMNSNCFYFLGKMSHILNNLTNKNTWSRLYS